MIFKSRDFTYEVIRKIAADGSISYWQCKCLEDDSGCFLVQFNQAAQQAVILRLIELYENPAFTDLKEYFIEQAGIVAVFPYLESQTLQEYLSGDDPVPLNERFTAGQRILERLLLLQLPMWLLAEVLDPSCIYPAEDPVGFRYRLQGIGAQTTPEWGQIQERLRSVTGVLFQSELSGGLYPEIEALLSRLEAGPFEEPELLAVYQAYIGLLPVCQEERQPEVKEKKSFKERIGKLIPKLVTAFKLLMGGAVLFAAVTMLPAWWQAQVVPVWNAGKLWKAVYVDGETLAPETEPETEAESKADPDNGLVTRYWENGNICYRGYVVDGMYEGRGTSCYKNGAIEYQGEYSFGKKNGEGSQYTAEGVLLYEGGFKNDKYEGEGRLYDEATGNLIYEGGFAGGKYNGVGILYDPLSEFPLYDGSFRRGFYDGKGVEYDSNGARLYEGDFLLGVYHGYGIYYEAATGITLMEGEFRNGMPIPDTDAGLAEAELLDENLASPSDTTEKGVNWNERAGASVVVPEAG